MKILIGTKEYDTLKEAVEEAKENDMIFIIGKNETLESSLT